jgi:hypothetical protein
MARDQNHESKINLSSLKFTYSGIGQMT